MTRKVITFIKRDGIESDKNSFVAETDQTKDDQGKMANTVNDWIAERRKNSRTEKIFSDGRILAWKLIP